MANWVTIGLRTGIKTSSYPAKPDRARGISPGRPAPGDALADAESVIERCPTAALYGTNDHLHIDHGRCVHCFRCADPSEDVHLDWESGYEWGTHAREMTDVRVELDRRFGRSLHIRFIDAGACSACISEARQLNNPYYNLHRLGFFVTATPRNADVLLVAGPVTDAMRLPLRKAYEAMPSPKRVIAIGACAISGGVFGPSFISAGGASELVPVDVVVPGCPPPPLAILHGLLVLVRRKPPCGPISKPAPEGGSG